MKYIIQINPELASEETVKAFFDRIASLAESIGLDGIEIVPMKSKATRHPSEITLDEFLHIAKIIDPTTNEKGFRLDVKYGSISLVSERRFFEINFNKVFQVEAFNKNVVKSISYGFNQSIKIAAYLDSIGIDYALNKPQ